MHMHTEYSRDSRVALADFAELARKAHLGAVCITDHDTIEGGLRLREMNTGLQVIGHLKPRPFGTERWSARRRQVWLPRSFGSTSWRASPLVPPARRPYSPRSRPSGCPLP